MKYIRYVILLLIVSLVFSLTSCSSINDKEYTLTEISGTYIYSTYRNGTTYDYYLLIEKDKANGWRESYTFEGDRYGMPHTISDKFSGTVILTKKNITIGSYTGYIKTDSTITITLDDITYVKK